MRQDQFSNFYNSNEYREIDTVMDIDEQELDVNISRSEERYHREVNIAYDFFMDRPERNNEFEVSEELKNEYENKLVEEFKKNTDLEKYASLQTEEYYKERIKMDSEAYTKMRN